MIKLRFVHSFHSKRMLATYKRRMRNNNLETKIAGFSCRPQMDLQMQIEVLLSCKKKLKSH